MKARGPSRRPGSFRLGAFTVLELMVAVSALTVIVFVLYKVFDQTQRALRSNTAQVDVMEGGRSALELVTREFAQITGGGVFSNVNFSVLVPVPPRLQSLVLSNEARLNVLQQVYFLTRSNRTWYATAYRVLEITNSFGPGGVARHTNFAAQGYGYLARTVFPIGPMEFRQLDPFPMVTRVAAADMALYQPIVDGIVHFRVTAYDSAGQPMVYPRTNYVDALVGLDARTLETIYRFTNQATPASVEIELGVLEPQVIDRLKSFPTAAARSNYLAQVASRVQLFQQRVPIRSARKILPVQ